MGVATMNCFESGFRALAGHEVGDQFFIPGKQAGLLKIIGLGQVHAFPAGGGAVIEHDAVFVQHLDGNDAFVLNVEVDRFRDRAAARAFVDFLDLGKPGDDVQIAVNVVDKAFDIDRNFPGEQELLLVELSGHLLLKRLVKELAEDDDEGKNDEQRKDESRGGEKVLLLQSA